jgi:hypothetical protein
VGVFRRVAGFEWQFWKTEVKINIKNNIKMRAGQLSCDGI